MRKERHSKKSTWEKSSEWISLVSGFAGIFMSLLGLFLSFYVSQSKPPTPDILSVTHSLVYVVGGIILLGLLIVAIASFMQRKDRDVIFLKQRLAEIYLSALRKSALNPKLKSSPSHD